MVFRPSEWLENKTTHCLKGLSDHFKGKISEIFKLLTNFGGMPKTKLDTKTIFRYLNTKIYKEV